MPSSDTQTPPAKKKKITLNSIILNSDDSEDDDLPLITTHASIAKAEISRFLAMNPKYSRQNLMNCPSYIN